MANPNGNPQNLKPRQKGMPSLNPSGKPKQLLTKDKVSAILGRFSTLTPAELDAVMKSPKSTMIEIMIASVMSKAAKDGDYARLDFLLTRSVGKVKEEIEQTVKNIPHEDLEQIPRDALIKLVSGT